MITFLTLDIWTVYPGRNFFFVAVVHAYSVIAFKPTLAAVRPALCGRIRHLYTKKAVLSFVPACFLLSL